VGEAKMGGQEALSLKAPKGDIDGGGCHFPTRFFLQFGDDGNTVSFVSLAKECQQDVMLEFPKDLFSHFRVPVWTMTED